MAITLDQLLESRDRRAAHQKDLLGRYPGKSLLCMTVQLPGAEKRNALSLRIAAAGVAAIREAFGPSYEELQDLETGYEAFFLVPMPPQEAKRRCCTLEEIHPLGRLMDIDVLGPDGIPIERAALGLPPRPCLLCGRPARVCMRAKNHSQAELLAEIRRRITDYCNNS